MVNAFAFWQGKSIEEAPKTLFEDLVGAAKRIADKAPRGTSPYVAIGETGWPTGSSICNPLCYCTVIPTNTYII